MVYHLKLGGLTFRVISHEPLVIEDSIVPFLCPDVPGQRDVVIEFSSDYHLAPVPVGPMAGEDLLLRYYIQDRRLICEAIGGPKGPLAISVCSHDCASWTCYMNTAVYPPLGSIGNLMRLVPIPMILQRKGAMLFHAAQIAYNGAGILFAAPSGTGKTTQAKLWRDLRGARIICNDRTLVRNGCTYGYPMDGSEPVCSSETHPLGAVVLLRQSPNNCVHQLKPGTALANLMPQLVFNTWDSTDINTAAGQLLELMTRFPVYQLSCTPDEAAVLCLENRLKTDGVI